MCPVKVAQIWSFSPGEGQTTRHVGWYQPLSSVWQMGRSGCCWGVWRGFAPGAGFSIPALILGMA